MDVNEVFEHLYKSVAEDEKNYEIESISGSSQNSSTVNNVMDRQMSAPSPKIALEMFTQYPKHLNTDSKSYKCGKSMLSTERKENLSLHISKCGVDAKSSTSSLQEKNCTVYMQNGSDKLYEEPDFEDSYSTRGSDLEYSYERVDGYESGVTKEQSAKQYLCKECRKLYKKARKIKHTTEEIPKKPEYSHWRSTFWMMMNRVPSQKRNKRKKEQNRTLTCVVRQFRTCRQTSSFCLRCCRIHSFLKRNLRLSTIKKSFHSLNSRQKRKRPTSAQKSSQKSTTRRKEESFSYSLEKSDTKTTYMFVLDSSEEEDTRLNVKRYKLLGEEIERNLLQKQRDNPLHLPDTVQPINTWEEHNTEHADIIDSPATQDKEDLGIFNQRFSSNPQDSDGSLDEAGPSFFGHVQSGSFKELLQRMNSGYLRSGVVKENRI